MATRTGRLRRISTLLPLAMVSAAWTASLTGTQVAPASADQAGGMLPDGTRVPARAIEAPASLSTPGELAPGIQGSASQAVSTASTNGIPSAALAAYQRAETVINSADPGCHMPWELVAAIGRVESDHGRTNGNVLTAKGIAKPGIYGIPLDGTHGTTKIKDTDAGQYDRDSKWDRAVGPMQFIPSTWSVVGVDADNDGKRNPQDINDAALASSVYLCSGSDDLGGDTGRRSAVFRYNHSKQYVDLVLAIMHAYMSGDFTSVPNGVTTTTSFVIPTGTGWTGVPGGHQHQGHQHHGHHQGPATDTGTTDGPTAVTTTTAAAGPSGDPTSVPTSAAPTSAPTSLPTSLPTSVPTSLPSDLPTSAVTSQVATVLSAADALTLCTKEFAKISDPLGLLDGKAQSCADKVTGETKDQALQDIPNTLDAILAWLG